MDISKKDILGIHKWLGLIAGLFVLVMGISGSLLAPAILSITEFIIWRSRKQKRSRIRRSRIVNHQLEDKQSQPETITA